MAVTVPTLFVCFFISFVQVQGALHINPSLRAQNEADGNRLKYTINLKDDKEDDSGNSDVNEIGKRFRRYLRTSNSVKSKPFAFYDRHYIAEVHWSGANSSSVMVLMRDPDNLISASRPSTFYVSRDYGNTYTNVTGNFTLGNGGLATISSFFSSKADNRKYILVAKFHRVIFFSLNECQTFYRVSTYFYPSAVKYHPRHSFYVAIHEEEMGSKRLYASSSNGRRWGYKASDVQSFSWGYSYPSDTGNYLYYFKKTRNGGVLYKSSPYFYFFHRANILESQIEDFLLINQYIFATKNGTIPGTKDLLISTDRTNFHKAIFPFSNNTNKDGPKLSMSFLIADATEDETFVAVAHEKKYSNLYISDREGKKFSLALKNVLYFNQVDKAGSRYFRHDFVELHRVLGVSGVYIATNLTEGVPKKRHLQSWITFNKGGDWTHLRPPPEFCVGKSGLCALQLSQEYGLHNPLTKFSPIYSKASAPGFIIATGNVGPYLNSSANVFLSTDAGISWKRILTGNHYYAFVDHGGIIVAIRKFSFVDTLRFSWDEGHSWQDYKFTKSPVRVYGLLTEPGERSTVFTIYASKAGGHSWVVIQVNFKDFLGRACRTNDYYLWELSDLRNNSQHCSLGKKQKFERRLADTKCYNGYNYDRPVQVSNCLCTREDFTCDFGYNEYVLGWFGVYCFPDFSVYNKTRMQPSWCRPGLVYNISSGYRKIPGDTCEGGDMEKRFLPETRACDIDPIDEFVLYAMKTYIVRYDMKQRRAIHIQLNDMKNVISVDYDYAGQTLIYADVTLDKIMRMNLTTGHIHEVIQFNESRRYVEGIAYDWLNRDVFYTDVGSAEIGVVSLDGRFKKTLWGPRDVVQPRGIAVHPIKGLMVWTEKGTSPSVMISNMDGTGKRVLASANVKVPNDVTFDYDNDLVYWIDSDTDRISSINIDGSGLKVVVNQQLSSPYSLDIFKDKVIWDDWGRYYSSGLYTTYKNGESAIHQRLVYASNALALRAFWKGKQKTIGNPCAGHNCTFKCLPSHGTDGNGKFTCACPDMLIPVPTPEQCKCPGDEIFDRTTLKCKPAKNETCNSHQFTCKIRHECIPAHWKCDGDKDCSDGSDEAECSKPEVCRSNQFQCDNGACVLKTWKCDGEEDCSDGSDENGCKKTTCAPDHVMCPTSECISSSWLCDNEDDCDDGWDEKNCNSTATTTTPAPLKCKVREFSCVSEGVNKCLSDNLKCNGDQDCDNGFDETGCVKKKCNSKEWPCSSGYQCIPKKYRCNGQYDCYDDSDEDKCPHTIPPTGKPTCDDKNTMKCDNGTRCYGKEQQCNGYMDCNDGTDEMNCTKPTRPSTTQKRCEVSCKGSKKCISFNQVCNGYQDCPNGDDESKENCQCFRCKDTKKCATRCNGKKECRGGEDEENCKGGTDGKVDCRLPSPFSMKCDHQCFNITVRCNHMADCVDASDEPSDCQKTNRVRSLTITGDHLKPQSVLLTWNHPDKVTLDSTIGYNIKYISLENTHRTQNIDLGVVTSHEINNLEKCTKYIFAIALKMKAVKQHLYIEQSFETGGWKTQNDFNNFPVIVHQDSLAWEEAKGACAKKFASEIKSRMLQCGVLDGDVIDLSAVNIELDNPGSIANPWRLFPADEQLSEFHCQIVIEYIPDGSMQDGRVFTVVSEPFIMSKKNTPSSGGHTGTSGGKSKGTKTMMWAIPVALVVLALFAGLGVMVYKYRRLQHSFLAFAARGNYTRQEDDLEDDDNMVVGFHAGEDAPMINRFSDDEPLVVA